MAGTPGAPIPAGPSSVTPPENQRALLAHDPAVPVDEREFALLHLASLCAAHDLPRRFGDVRHAARDPRLSEAQLPAVRVQRKVTVELEIVFLHERATLALLREPRIF